MKREMSIFLTASLIIISYCNTAHAISVTEFYNLMNNYSHINAFAATVQCAHETGNWQSPLWINANNGAGLKAPKAWIIAGKPYIAAESPESNNGTYYKKTSYFRKYNSTSEFLSDYANKIRVDYPRCARNNDNIWGYFAGLYSGRIGKWATDHKYYEKLTIKAIKLAPEIFANDWKLKLARDYYTAVQRKSLDMWQRQIIEKQLREVGAL